MTEDANIGEEIDRGRKLRINTITAIICQATSFVCGFVLPRFFLGTYGSNVYGLVSSITQFLSFVSLMDLGVGAVVQSALYHPLAMKDKNELNIILSSARRYFNRIAILFFVYLILLIFIYPMIVEKGFTFLFVASLIVIISVSYFAEYFFGIVYKLLLVSDQRGFIPNGLRSIALVLNAFICIVLMKAGASIHLVKLVSSFVFLLSPFVQSCYVRKKYAVNTNVSYVGEPLKQKWNGLAQHIAHYVTTNTDTIVLSIFSSLENVSVYAVYNMIIGGIRTCITTLNSGVQALFGNLLASGQYEDLKKHFYIYEWDIHTIATLLFSCTGILIIPFIRIYTSGITDANYIQPLFAWLLVSAQAAYCIRIPYSTMICVAGHYRQTQISAMIEMALNISISVVLVFNYGLIGVAVGTLVSLIYRTVYFVSYLSKNIIYYSFSNFLKNIVVDTIEFIIIYSVTSKIPKVCTTFPQWTILAFIVFSISLIVVLGVNGIAYREHIIRLGKKFLKLSKKRIS